MAKKRSTAAYAGIPDSAPSAQGLRGRPYVRRCAAMNRRYERCGCPAMRGKPVCRKHGGKGGRKPTHGLYSYDPRKVGEEIAEKMKRHLNNPNITDLKEELALVRAYFENYLAIATPASSYDPPPLTSEFCNIFLSFASRIARLAKTQSEIEWGPQHLITATQATTFYQAVLEGVRRHTSDPREAKAIHEYIESALGLAGLDEKRIHAVPPLRD